MKFYIVCGWDQYYPYGGINNIMLVTTSREEALDFIDRKDVKALWDRKDYYELFDSTDLPWSTVNNLSSTLR